MAVTPGGPWSAEEFPGHIGVALSLEPGLDRVVLDGTT